MLNNVYGGLLLLKFIAPNAKVKFSEMITLSNVNGVPCLELRIGNEDGSANLLKDLRARLAYSYRIEYTDENGKMQHIGQTQELHLIHDSHMQLGEIVWTLRHKIDESSPLFGLDFLEFPGNKIYAIEACFNGTQENTGSPVFCQMTYTLDELMIGHKFVDQISFNEQQSIMTVDYGTFNETVPHPVWYPCSRKADLIPQGQREALAEVNELSV
jgi:inward rectifier potassium channel